MDFSKDYEFLKKINKKYIIGIDEVGKGSLSGPVISCACILLNTNIIGIKDSKKLNDKKRRSINDILINNNNCLYSIGESNVEEINDTNIVISTGLSFFRSLNNLFFKYSFLKKSDCVILIDGNNNFNIENSFNVIKGDDTYMSIAAASIIAKIYRDDLMINLSKKYSIYKWNNNKGYGTKEHITAIKEFGISDMHRLKFVRNFI